MKKPPDTPTFNRFTEAMKTILKVPKSAVESPFSSPKEKQNRAVLVSHLVLQRIGIGINWRIALRWPWLEKRSNDDGNNHKCGQSRAQQRYQP
jgi:hypothetical protein